MGVENGIDPKVKAVTVRAIRRMVGDNLTWDGPIQPLVDLVILKPEAFEHDSELKAMRRMGRVVQKVAEMIDRERTPTLDECIKPEFWRTDKGVRVQRELKKTFDNLKQRTKIGS